MNDPAKPETPAQPATPRRGAIPTPRSVIEKARPYVPAADPSQVEPAPRPAPPAGADKGREG